jgi:hypothetical protein
MVDYFWLVYVKNGSIHGSFLGSQSDSQSRLNRVITPRMG